VNANRWLPGRSEVTDVTLRVFCLPHAGGGASAFRGWTTDQPAGVEICAVQLPGREDRIREPLPGDIVALARALADILLPYLDVPYVLVGNSIGGLVAFEIARHAEQRHCLPPVRLVVASCRPPGVGLGLPVLSGLADDEFTAVIHQRYGGIPLEILRDPGRMAVFLPALRADIAMSEAYLPSERPLLACPVTAVVGTDDMSLSYGDLKGWSTFTEAAFDCAELAGDHFVLLSHREDVLGPICAEAALVRPPAATVPSGGRSGSRAGSRPG
jgi:medium-chain acyl-[acyl-carrier-protein] hydrolase